MLKPTGDNVLIKPIEEESGRIIIPDSAKERPQLAEVIAVGPGKMHNGGLRKMAVSVGDKILHRRYAPIEVEYEGEEYLILREADIFAAIE